MPLLLLSKKRAPSNVPAMDFTSWFGTQKGFCFQLAALKDNVGVNMAYGEFDTSG